ncbi:inositol monophosphatase family protein [Nonomuraea wenchangensis]
MADGRIDAGIMLSNSPWDTAAGVIIAREAGATVVDLDGRAHTVWPPKRRSPPVPSSWLIWSNLSPRPTRLRRSTRTLPNGSCGYQAAARRAAVRPAPASPRRAAAWGPVTARAPHGASP